jgi:hypothetical protein
MTTTRSSGPTDGGAAAPGVSWVQRRSTFVAAVSPSPHATDNTAIAAPQRFIRARCFPAPAVEVNGSEARGGPKAGGGEGLLA